MLQFAYFQLFATAMPKQGVSTHARHPILLKPQTRLCCCTPALCLEQAGLVFLRCAIRPIFRLAGGVGMVLLYVHVLLALHRLLVPHCSLRRPVLPLILPLFPSYTLLLSQSSLALLVH